MSLRDDDIVLLTFQQVDVTDFKLPIIAVYDKPTDYPNEFVARMYDTDKATHMIMLADSLEDIRMYMPTTMTILARAKSDDMKIVEVWI